MRKFFGWVLFVVGVVFLGWWARGHQAVEIESRIVESANMTAEQFEVGQIQPEVIGRDITLRGVVLEDDHKAVVDAFDDIDGRRVVRSELDLAKYFGPNLTANFDAATGLILEGSTTSEVDGKVVATLMAAPLAADKLEFDSAGDFGAAKDKLAGVGEYLRELDRAQVTVVGDQVSVTGEVASDKDSAGISTAISDALGGSDQVEITNISSVNDGDVRTNVWTGEFEVYTAASGRWLPSVNFERNLENCQTQTDKLLQENRILFVTGSAEVDAESSRVVDLLAGTLRHCLDGDQLALVLGGHTDSDGDDQANLRLSQERAQAVVNAIAGLGIDIANVAARGFGESQPIADNATDEGKAANRRTTITWSVN